MEVHNIPRNKNYFFPKGVIESNKYIKMANPTHLHSSILTNMALQKAVYTQEDEIETLIGSKYVASLLHEIEKYNELIKSNSMIGLLDSVEKTEKVVKNYTFYEALNKTRSEYAFIIKALEDK